MKLAAGMKPDYFGKIDNIELNNLFLGVVEYLITHASSIPVKILSNLRVTLTQTNTINSDALSLGLTAIPQTFRDNTLWRQPLCWTRRVNLGS